MKKISLLLFAFALSFSACKKETETNTTNTNTNQAPKTYKVKYTMVCTDCEVIYVSDTLGTQSTAFHQNSTWSYTFNAKKNQELLFLAYNQSSTIQGVTATILLNDTVLSTQTTYCPFNGAAFCADTVR